MTSFEEWWMAHKKEHPELAEWEFDLIESHARAAWEAAKQDAVDELNDSIRKAWPEEEDN